MKKNYLVPLIAFCSVAFLLITAILTACLLAGDTSVLTCFSLAMSVPFIAAPICLMAILCHKRIDEDNDYRDYDED